MDLDNQKAIDEVCSCFGAKDLEELSRYIIVEQHKDDLSKAHLYFYSNHEFKKKSSDVTKLGGKINNNEIPAIEVKGKGEHGIAFCSPSLHKDGARYEIIGIKEPKTCGKDVEDALFEIYKKYNLNIDKNNQKLPIEELFEKDFVILEGHNRHEGLLRVMESLIRRLEKMYSEEEIKKLANNWNLQHCKPPLNNKEFEKQWEDSKKFIEKKNIKSIDNKKLGNNEIINKQNNAEVTINESIIDNDATTAAELFDKIPDKKFVEYVIQIAQKTIKQEDSLIRLILYTGLSTYTKNPLNLGILAPTSEGKTYAVSETIKLLPKQDVWIIGSMSPKVIVRDRGILVDNDNNPIGPKLQELKEKVKHEKDEDIREELKDQMKLLYQNSKVLIDLTNKILVFLEPPHEDTWKILKAILSHDSL